MNQRRRVLHAAREYLRNGFKVVPVPYREKGPQLKGWPKLRLERRELREYFPDKCNIGLLLGRVSNDLVDVDLDCKEARRLAPHFLPTTSLVHGRESNRCSHWWYRAKDFRGLQKFNDVDGKSCLLELRSGGHQTLVPPSVHPSGERLRWEKEGKPQRVAIANLLRGIRQLAAATLMVRHWPSKGTRNQTAMALAGVLLRAGWDKSRARDFIARVAKTAGDEEWQRREAVVSHTQKRLEKGKPTTGIPELNRLVRHQVVDKLLEWLDIFSAPSNREARRTQEWPKPLGEDAYYGVAGELVRAIEPETEADPAALLLQLLAGFGNLVGPPPHFVIESAKQRANLFVLVVGRSAKARKGTAWAHVRRILEQVDTSWSNDCLATNLSSGEGLIWAVRDEDIKEKSEKRRSKSAVDDKTVRKRDNRLLVVQSEFASVLRIQRREGNVLSPIIRQAWDSGNLRILTKHSPCETRGAHISIVGHVTMDELHRELSQTDEASGYANRFLFVCAERKRLLPLGGQIDWRVLRPFLEKLLRAKLSALRIERMDLSKKAKQLWRKFYSKLSMDVPGMLGAITARAEAQVLRLALIYALLDRSVVIETQHLRAAYAVWKYCARSARFIFGGTLGEKVADRILQALRESRRLTRNEIRELFSRNLAAERIDHALSFLSRHKLATSETETTDGRPAEIWTPL
jgi:hypothetical protein